MSVQLFWTFYDRQKNRQTRQTQSHFESSTWNEMQNKEVKSL
jgi:hypothetical protein